MYFFPKRFYAHRFYVLFLTDFFFSETISEQSVHYQISSPHSTLDSIKNRIHFCE